MKKTIRLFLALVFLGSSFSAFAQQSTITGKVTGADDKQGLPGATVMIKGSNTVAISDNDGNYKILASQGQTLVFTYMGYTNKEFVVGTSNVINVELGADATLLDELVVVGYGAQKKESLTGAVSSVDVGKALDSRPISDIGRALQGTTAGLNISTLTGEIGASPTIKIRGIIGSSNGSSNPLILVDNVVVPDLSFINPDDVESISVLKDAATSAIYGARAAFGVILVTTKSKKTNDKTSISYTNNFAWRTPTVKAEQLPAWQQGEMTLMSLSHYGTARVTEYKPLGTIYVNEASIQKMKEWEQLYGGQNLGSEMVYGRDFEITPSGKQYYYRPWDWYDMFYKDWMPQQTHNLTVNGGNGKLNYNMALGYLSQEGMTTINPDTYTKYNASASINAEAYKWLKLRANTLLTKTERETPFVYSSSSIYDYLYYLWRWQPTYPYGTYNGQPFRSAISELQQASMNVTTNNYNRLGFGATANIIEGLTVDADFTYTSIFGIEKINGGGASGLNFWNLGSLSDLANSYTKYTTAALDYVQQNDSKSETYTTNAYATYSKRIKEHSFRVMAGTNIESNVTSGALAKRMNLYDYSKPELNLAYGTPSVGSNHSEWSIAGFFGRINYSFKDRYLVELNGRYDGSSAFPANHKWGFFPSMSVGYRITEEPFMQVLKPYLSSLKLRASYGSIGNQDVGSFRYISTIDMNSAYSWLVNGTRSIYGSTPTVVSPDLTWETVTSIDFGFDARLWKDKIGLTFDWYKRTTSNIQSAGELLPLTFGAQAPYRNSGEIQTPGWEITLDFSHTFANGLRIGVNGQLTDFYTKVTKWSTDVNTLPAYNQWTDVTRYYEGATLGDIWGYEVDRLYQVSDFTKDAAGNWLLNPGIASQVALESSIFRFAPGDVKFKDADNSGTISQGDNTNTNPGDKRVIGNTLPRYQYGFRFNAAWKNFDFDIFFQGVGQRKLWVGGNMVLPGFTAGEPLFKGQEDYWTEANPNAFYAAPASYDQLMRWNYEINDRYLLNMAYLRCKTLTVGYTLPAKLTKKVYIERVRVYFTAENLFTFDKLGDVALDPEIGITSGTNATGGAVSDPRTYGRSYPYQQTLSFGIQIGL